MLTSIIVLMHKRNENRNMWYYLTTDGTVEKFSKKTYNNIRILEDILKKHMKADS